MNAGFVVPTQRRLLAWVIAATLALTAVVGTQLVDQIAGTSLTPTAAACHSNGGGC